MTPILQAQNVSKRFPGVLANDRVSFALEPGEILAFLGENGAGKSTLMNILYGLYAPDEGEVQVRGIPVEIQDPNDAIKLGIGMVHQHFQLVPVFTVTENIVMGMELIRRIDRGQAYGLTMPLLTNSEGKKMGKSALSFGCMSTKLKATEI